MAERFKASKFGQAIAADLAAPVQKSEIGNKHHGEELVSILDAQMGGMHMHSSTSCSRMHWTGHLHKMSVTPWECARVQLLHQNKYPLRGRDLFWICWEVRLEVPVCLPLARCPRPAA
jgi:hypothetical protein